MTILKKYFFIFGLILIAAPGATHALATGVEIPYHPSPVYAGSIDLTNVDVLSKTLSQGIHRSNVKNRNVAENLTLIQQLTELAFHLQSETLLCRQNKELLSSIFINSQTSVYPESFEDVLSTTSYIQLLTAICISQISDYKAPHFSFPSYLDKQVENYKIPERMICALFFLVLQKPSNYEEETAVTVREKILVSLLKQSDISAETLVFFIHFYTMKSTKRHPLKTLFIASILAHEKFSEEYLEQLCAHENKTLAAIASVTIIQNPQAIPEDKYTALFQAATRLRSTVNAGMLYRTFLQQTSPQNITRALAYFNTIDPLIALAEDYIDKGGASLKEVDLDPIKDRMNQLEDTRRLDYIDLNVDLSGNFDSPWVRFIKCMRNKMRVNWLNSKL